MFLLKKILCLFTKGRGNAVCADKLPERLGECGAPVCGRVVRTDGAPARGFAGEGRGAFGGASSRGRSFQAAEEGDGAYAWYFAVRDWFARTPQESGFRRTIGGGAVRRAAEERGTRGRIAAAEPSAPFRRGDSFGRIAACRSAGEESFRAKQAMFGVDDEFFAPLLSLRGLNLAEHMRGEK